MRVCNTELYRSVTPTWDSTDWREVWKRDLVADAEYNHRNSLVYERLHSDPVLVAPRESRTLRVFFCKDENIYLMTPMLGRMVERFFYFLFLARYYYLYLVFFLIFLFK